MTGKAGEQAYETDGSNFSSFPVHDCCILTADTFCVQKFTALLKFRKRRFCMHERIFLPMLKLEYLFENFDLARYALEDYPHDASRLEESLKWFRISSNAVYPFFDDHGLNFLRLCPVQEKSPDMVAGEIEFIDYLIDRGFWAMKPIVGFSGEKCRKLDTPWGTYCVSAFRGVSGISIEDTELTESVLYAYGRALGQLHRLSMRFTPHHKRKTYEEIAGEMRLHLPEELCSVLDRVMENLAQIPRTQENFGLVHYDFEPDNVFYDAAAGKIHVIDFDDCLYHYYALDVEQSLASLAELIPEHEWQMAKGIFLDGYRSEHSLPEEMEEKLPLMRQFVDLRAYARLSDCLDSKPLFHPSWLDELMGRLEEKRAALKKSLLRWWTEV